MGYPGSHLKLVVSGDLYGGAEKYSWGLSLVPRVGDTVAAVGVGVPTAIRDALAIFHATFGGAASFRMQTVKLNRVGEDGRYTEPTTTQYDWPSSGLSAAAATAAYPPQIAIAITLRTAVKRGLAASGRFFVPMLNNPGLGTDGRMAQGGVDSIRGNATTLVNSLNAMGADWVVGVASRGTLLNPNRAKGTAALYGPGEYRPVTGIQVGRVLDTIRSRRDQLREEYPAASIVP